VEAGRTQWRARPGERFGAGGSARPAAGDRAGGWKRAGEEHWQTSPGAPGLAPSVPFRNLADPTHHPSPPSSRVVANPTVAIPRPQKEQDPSAN
jgi:hypothetical protein